MNNHVLLIGRLTAKPELRESSNGKKFMFFTLAVQSNKENTDFIDCVAWEKTAEIINTYGDKGKQIAVGGRIQQRKNKDNKNVIEVVVTNVTLL